MSGERAETITPAILAGFASPRRLEIEFSRRPVHTAQSDPSCSRSKAVSLSDGRVHPCLSELFVDVRADRLAIW
jgi:hypothetical protein